MVKREDKRGVIGMIVLFIILFTILIIGFTTAIFLSAIDFTSDTVTPIMEDLGVIDEGVNMSEYAEYTFTKVNIVVQALPWVAGFGYVAALIFVIVFVISLDFNPHPVYIGFYFMLIILLILGSIIISNVYQDLHQESDEIATRLQEQVLLSYLILYSPFIMTLIAIISGIILFTKAPTGGVGI